MCQVLGYHRISSMASDTEHERDEKIALFWYLYLMDKSTSLRLGQPYTLQDYDISLPIPIKSTVLPYFFIPTLHYWVDLSKIQGQIIERLYSPAAALETQQERHLRAAILCEALKEVFSRHEQIEHPPVLNAIDAIHTESFQSLISGTGTVLFQSTLTLTQYSMPLTASGVSPALEAARSALKAMQISGKEHSDANVYFRAAYCHWAALNTPFTPFIVLLDHVTATPLTAGNDLELLQHFTTALGSASGVSDGIDHFHKLCSLLFSVAEAYVLAKSHEDSQKNELGGSNEVTFSEMLQPSASELGKHLEALEYTRLLPSVPESGSTDNHAVTQLGSTEG